MAKTADVLTIDAAIRVFLAKRTDVLVPESYVTSHTASNQLCERETRLADVIQNTRFLYKGKYKVYPSDPVSGISWLIVALCNRYAILSTSL